MTAPSILLTATLRWPIAARLAIAFAKLGCRVEAVCPRQHPASRTARAVARLYPYALLRPLESLRAAIESAEPDLIIPCDDDAAMHLRELFVLATAEGAPARELRALIARSLGTPDACALATERGRFLSLAAEEGVRIPATAIVESARELCAWCSEHGFPAVLKIDRSWGGQGVAIVPNLAEARQAFARLVSRPSIRSTAAQVLLHRDPSALLNLLKKAPRRVTVQAFIAGSPANRAVACWNGEVLAGCSVEALRTLHPTGPATVVRIIDHPEMTGAVNRLVRRLGISGLWGVDFVLEASTGAAYLIEVNPRATPICHLPLAAGRNLPAALYAQLAGTSPPVPLATIDHDVIAMFPGEWQRDSTSAFLHSHYHDIPWDDPGLIQECVDRPYSERGLIALLWARVRRKPARIRIQGVGEPSGSREQSVEPRRVSAAFFINQRR
jgi:glutathione synthase/RimK-type ligase-like ATP-grasp enzyme